MTAELTLDLPWVTAPRTSLAGLLVRRGRTDMLSYDDGIVLAVHVIDPTSHASPASLVEAVRSADRPGRVVLVAGAVPVAWRSRLRDAAVSFVDVSGVAEIVWPRLEVSARHFGQSVTRQRTPLPFQKGHALVVEELLALSLDGPRPTISELASGAVVSLATASRAVAQLAEHGLVTKHRKGRTVSVEVTDRVGAAMRLAERTGWPGDERLSGYLWGRTIFDVAARLSHAAAQSGIGLAVTGRVGAAFYGVLGTSSPTEVRCWVPPGLLNEIAGRLGLEPAPAESANVVLSTDRWRLGTHRSQQGQFDDFTAVVAHPLRVWCDLHDEPRGSEYAAQLWGGLLSGR